MATFQSVDEFLNFRGQEGGASTRLKNWKEKGFFNAFFHRGLMPSSVWYHRIPELVVRRDKDDPSRQLHNVWSRQFVCFEDEKILKKQRFRTPEGLREHPPIICPDCRLLEVIRAMVLRGDIKDTDVVFEWSGSDKPEENCVRHAGGITGLWKQDKMTPADKERLAQHGIYMANSGKKFGAWNEKAIAQLNYIFAVVNAEDAAAGLQVDIQTQGLGDKVKKTINKEIASNGASGNPFTNPYCIQFQYKPSEPKFDDKYDAQRMNIVPLTPSIQQLIDGEPPDISRYTRLPDLATHRAMLETHAKVSLPWDEIFGPAERAEKVRRATSAPDQAASAAPIIGPQPAPASPPPVARVREKPPEEWGDPCDPPCNAPMLKGQTVCGKCGAKYAVTPDAPAASAPVAPASPVPVGPSGEEPIYDDGDIPF